MSSPSTPSEQLALSPVTREIYDEILAAMENLEGPFVTVDEYLIIMADLKRRCAEQAATAAANAAS